MDDQSRIFENGFQDDSTFSTQDFENGFQDDSTFSTHDSDVFPNFPISQRTQTLLPGTHQYKPWRSMKWTPK